MAGKITRKQTGLIVLLLLVIFQFFRINTTNPAVDPSKDIITATHASSEIAGILKTSCYDCHSNEVTYPWYTNIAPVSWWIKHHINEGREELNFSTWQSYSAKKADYKLKECIEMVTEGEMPLSSYTLIHTHAKLSKAQRNTLVNWFNSLRTGAESSLRKN